MRGDATPWVDRVLIVDDGPERAANGDATVTGISAETGAPLLEIRYFAPEIRNHRAAACAGGHRQRAARRPGIGKTTMYQKLRQYALEPTAGIPP